MKTWWGIAFGIVGGLLGAGLLWLVASPPRGPAITLQSPPPPPAMVIHVEGAVASPGVYLLEAGSRVMDAVAAAGGLLDEADTEFLNLAARLMDGDQIRVPSQVRMGEPALGAVLPNTVSEGNGTGSPSTAKLDINRATRPELETLPGIGPVTAEKIIAYRQAHGPFATPEDIQQVSGIGPATFARIRDLITAGSAHTSDDRSTHETPIPH